MTIAQRAEPVRTIVIAPAPPRPIAPPEGADARQVLAEALREKSAADAAVAAAREALARGGALMIEAEAAVDRAGETEQTATATLGERLARWLAAGGTGDRPVVASGAGSGKVQAEAELAAASAARETLGVDLGLAEHAALDAEMRVCGAIEAIVRGIAEDDLARLLALARAADELRDRIAALQVITFAVPGALRRPIDLPPEILAIIRTQPIPPSKAAKSAWTDFAIRLRGDPDTVPDFAGLGRTSQIAYIPDTA